jgi:hypothetical protein
MKRIITAGICAAGLLAAPTTVAAVGPPAERFLDDHPAFTCAGDAGIPDNHCINVTTTNLADPPLRGTRHIVVLEPDARGPAEGISFDPKADSRPCPHDAPPYDGTDGYVHDGTWWEFPAPGSGIFVCHHRPTG